MSLVYYLKIENLFKWWWKQSEHNFVELLCWCYSCCDDFNKLQPLRGILDISIKFHVQISCKSTYCYLNFSCECHEIQNSDFNFIIFCIVEQNFNFFLLFFDVCFRSFHLRILEYSNALNLSKYRHSCWNTHTQQDEKSL